MKKFHFLYKNFPDKIGIFCNLLIPLLKKYNCSFMLNNRKKNHFTKSWKFLPRQNAKQKMFHNPLKSFLSTSCHKRDHFFWWEYIWTKMKSLDLIFINFFSQTLFSTSTRMSSNFEIVTVLLLALVCMVVCTPETRWVIKNTSFLL